MNNKYIKAYAVPLFLCLTLILVLFTAIPTATATTTSPTAQETCEEELGDDIWDLLWSEDEDSQIPPEDRGDYGNCEALLEERDWVWEEHPDLPKEWNDENYDLFEQEAGSDSESIVPDGESRDSSTHIRDAYISIGTTSPSTAVHTEGSSETTYIGESGDVYGVMDWRTRSTGTVTETTPQGSEVNYIRVYEGSTGSNQIGSTSEEHAWTVGYDDLDTDADEISVEAEIEVELDEEYWTTCGSGNSTFPCIRSRTVFEDVTVSDSIDVNVYDSEDPEATVAEMPDGSMEMQVELRDDGVWRSINNPDDEVTVQSGWYYYSQQVSTWHSWDVYDGGIFNWPSDQEVPSRLAETHTFYEGSGVRGTSMSVDVVDVDGITYSPPNLGANINVDQIDEEYQAPTNVQFTYPEYVEDGWTVKGIVGGVEEEIEITETFTVEEANLDANVEEYDEDSGEARVSVDLTDNDGNGINTQRNELNTPSDEYIEINGEQFDTNHNGEINDVWIEPDQGQIRIEYVPANWEDVDVNGNAYTGASTSELVVGEGEGFIWWLNEMFVWFGFGFLPLLVFIWLLDKAFAINIWPPWEEFGWGKFK